MDYLTFIARVIEAVAWPAAVVFAFWHLRGGLTNLIERVRLLKWKDAEADFGRQLDRVEDSAASAPAPSEKRSAEVPQLVVEAELPPAYVIQQAWLRVERALLEAANKSGDSIVRGQDRVLVKQIPYLVEKLRLRPAEVRLLNELRELRNRAVHHVDDHLTATDALRYRDLADRIVGAVEARNATAK